MTSPKCDGQHAALVREAVAGDSSHKAHVGVNVHSGLMPAVRCTAANVNDVVEGYSLRHGQETEASADAGYQDADKRPDAPGSVVWHVAMMPGKRKVVDKTTAIGCLNEQLEKVKASVLAKFENSFRLIMRQFRHVKVRCGGLAMSTAQQKTLFTLSNLWMAREKVRNTGWASPPGEAGCAVKSPNSCPCWT
jgi:IS5 family transposase